MSPEQTIAQDEIDCRSDIGFAWTVQSLDSWRYKPERNAVAASYLKIEKAGEYAFDSNNFYDRNVLMIDGRIVCGYGGGEAKIS